MSNLEIKIFNQLKDNYSYLVESKQSEYVDIVDPADSSQHYEYIKNKNLKLNSILLTHHHSDHTSGVNDLLKIYPSVKVYSPNKSIKGTTNIIKNNEIINTKINTYEVIATPGHTLDHVIFYDKINNLLFSGDTLFSLGCGRVFEGTFEQMYSSLKLVNELPNSTVVYCGHEYTLSNLKFLNSILNNEKLLIDFEIALKDKMEKYGRTIPFKLSLEKQMNPFLNPNVVIFRKIKKQYNLSDFQMFKFMREKKDSF